jgi:hypothetical protein
MPACRFWLDPEKKDALFWQKASFSVEINSYKPLA